MRSGTGSPTRPWTGPLPEVRSTRRRARLTREASRPSRTRLAPTREPTRSPRPPRASQRRHSPLRRFSPRVAARFGAELTAVEAGDAIALIRGAVTRPGGLWADLGAGSGMFTRALATLVGPGGTVYAVDNDPGALRELDRYASRAPAAT